MYFEISQLFSPTFVVLIQWLIRYAKRKNENESERESLSERESENERGNSLATQNPNPRRRASAPGMIELATLRPPRVAGPSNRSSLSVYQDAVVSIETDSESD